MQTTVGASEEENVRTSRAFVEAVIKKDVEKALTYFQDDATIQGPGRNFQR
jgi:hypothetical protein